ncbi:hypothetical protein [uncultured Phascolarctobacterium sp.]|uniref:hypothetical protein n=1 Tax=uncultured Phascolarctobacterium sp. TaxID=512296 RepID=UPI0025FF26EF|nr:hypothetical protein [uncultured Phascolarctobacterium sp.]
MKEKMYDFATLWLTASVLFFIIEYVTSMLQVVTLGGLVAGSFIEGLFMFLGLKLMHVIVSKEFKAAAWREALALRSDALKAWLVMAAFSMEGAITICRMLPGYELNFTAVHGIFLLLVYPAAVMFLEKAYFKAYMNEGVNK